MEGDPAQTRSLGAYGIFQSTPSVWRETQFFLNPFVVSIHFNPLPPYGGRRVFPGNQQNYFFISIHSLRMEGDYSLSSRCVTGCCNFNPLPPYGGRHTPVVSVTAKQSISIHSLRMEGDMLLELLGKAIKYFNPLPPYGGRLTECSAGGACVYFNPLPPHGGRHNGETRKLTRSGFQSTPSAWRETEKALSPMLVPGDFNPLPPHGGRPSAFPFPPPVPLYFNPLPPHGGRLNGQARDLDAFEFQSTPSAWRETCQHYSVSRIVSYFNPLPPHGGRPMAEQWGNDGGTEFQSTPSAWRETLCRRGSVRIPVFQSTPSAWRETRNIMDKLRMQKISIHSLRMEGD